MLSFIVVQIIGYPCLSDVWPNVSKKCVWRLPIHCLDDFLEMIITVVYLGGGKYDGVKLDIK